MSAWRLCVVLLLLVLTAGCADSSNRADPSGPADIGRYSLTLVTQHEHTVEDGQTSVGPLLLAGGALTVQEGGEHRGDVVALAGRLVVRGRVTGDVVGLGAAITLGPGAVVTGDVLGVDGTLEVDPAAGVGGAVRTDLDAAQVWGEPSSGPGLGRRALVAMVAALVAAALAWGLSRVAARPVRRVAESVGSYPVVCGALGTLVLLTAPALLVSMAFTLVLLPFAVVLLLPMALLTAYGLICVGQAVGGRLLRRRAPRLGAPGQAAVGTAVLVLVVATLGALPLVGAVSLLAAAAVGTGAALLTGLGTHGYAPPPSVLDSEGLSRGRSG